MIFSWFVLMVALCLSAVAAYYSIVGLAAIFAAAVIPIVVMGSILEVAKITVTIWLHQYWSHVQRLMRIYLVSAVGVLMLLTSMGIFGFLSKAHTDQTLITGDVSAGLILIDEKIKIQRENIANAQAVIKQMDATVQGIIEKGESREIKLQDGRTYTRSPAELALQTRRSQARDRDRLTREIEKAQAAILKLQEEAAPIRASVREVEAKVGPIKYIAALIYGDDPDSNLLERAVRWVIIIIVAVFDPLAVMMVLAATESMKWHTTGVIQGSTFRRHKEKESDDDRPMDDNQLSDTNLPAGSDVDAHNSITEPDAKHIPPKTPRLIDYEILEDFDGDMDPMDDPEVREFFQRNRELARKLDQAEATADSTLRIYRLGDDDLPAERPGDYVNPPEPEEPNFHDYTGEYLDYHGKSYRTEAFRSLRPDLFVKPAEPRVSYGQGFPKDAKKGDQWIRTDIAPTRVYKFNGDSWIEVDKNMSEAYCYDDNYISYLIQQISTGKYDPELLSDAERDQIEQRLKQDLD